MENGIELIYNKFKQFTFKSIGDEVIEVLNHIKLEKLSFRYFFRNNIYKENYRKISRKNIDYDYGWSGYEIEL